MLNLEQIRQLEEKVHQAVERMQSLRAENTELKKQINQDKRRIEELETEAKRKQTEQERIEAGVVNALSQLERLEEEVNSRNIQPETSNTDTAQETAAPAEDKRKPEETVSTASEEPGQAAESKSGDTVQPETPSRSTEPEPEVEENTGEGSEEDSEETGSERPGELGIF